MMCFGINFFGGWFILQEFYSEEMLLSFLNL